MSLDDALSQRERINAQLQAQMESVTDKWGIRINRIEIVDITPPQMILNALALQKTADQEKRAFILKSEGQQQSQINIADGQKQAQIKTAEGDKQSAILRAEGLRQATILEAEGRLPQSLRRSEEHTSELQSHSDLVCRLLLEKKKGAVSNVGTVDGLPNRSDSFMWTII